MIFAGSIFILALFATTAFITNGQNSNAAFLLENIEALSQEEENGVHKVTYYTSVTIDDQGNQTSQHGYICEGDGTLNCG